MAMADGNMDTPGSIFPTPHAVYFASILKLVAKTMRNITRAELTEKQRLQSM